MSIRLKNGELKLSAIKALVKAHNKAMDWDVKGLNRSDLIKFIEKKGYKVNHEKNILELTGSAMKRRPAKIKPIVKSSAELKKEMEKKTKAKATREKKKQQKQAVAKVGVPPLPTKETLKKVQEKKKLKEQLKKGETKSKSVSIGTQTAPKKRLKGKLTAIQKKQTQKEKAKKELLKGTPPPMTKKKAESKKALPKKLLEDIQDQPELDDTNNEGTISKKRCREFVEVSKILSKAQKDKYKKSRLINKDSDIYMTLQNFKPSGKWSKGDVSILYNVYKFFMNSVSNYEKDISAIKKDCGVSEAIFVEKAFDILHNDWNMIEKALIKQNDKIFKQIPNFKLKKPRKMNYLYYEPKN